MSQKQTNPTIHILVGHLVATHIFDFFRFFYSLRFNLENYLQPTTDNQLQLQNHTNMALVSAAPYLALLGNLILV